MNRTAAIILLTCATMGFNVGSVAGQVDWNKRVVVDDKPKSWEEVLIWLAAQSKTSLDLNKHRLPPGKVAIFVPEDKMGRQREYSLSEVFDVINQRLMVEENLTLLRNDTTLRVIQAGSFSDHEPVVVPRVHVRDLKDRPQTEIVKVLVKLSDEVDAEEFAPHAKRFIGSFGRVAVMPGNQLILQADVATLRKAIPECEQYRP